MKVGQTFLSAGLTILLPERRQKKSSRRGIIPETHPSHVRAYSEEGGVKVGQTFLSARLTILLPERRQKKSSR